MDFQISERIRSARMSRHISLEAIASALSTDPETVKGWEDGNALPQIAQLPALASALDLSVDVLLKGENAKVQKVLIGTPYSTHAYGRVTKSGIIDTLNQEYLPNGWRVVQTQLFVSSEGEDNVLVVIER